MTDTELIDFLEAKANEGYCPCLLNDDAGHWAISIEGAQNVPINPPCDIQTTFWVEKQQWKNSIREALESFASFMSPSLEVLESEEIMKDTDQAVLLLKQ
jgi:hypothetical protein